MGAENEYEMDIRELYKCGGLKFKGLHDLYHLFNT